MRRANLTFSIQKIRSSCLSYCGFLIIYILLISI